MCNRPKLPKAPTPAPEVPRLASREVQAAGDRERRRQRSAKGRGSTLLTGPRGTSQPAITGTKVLLGE